MKRSDLEELAKSYVAAQFSFDQEEIEALTAPNFVEVSPKGEVDERIEVIGFYAADRRTTPPLYAVSESKVRVSGRTAVITQVITIGQPPGSMSFTQSLSASHLGGKWLLTSSQSTPLRIEQSGK